MTGRSAADKVGMDGTSSFGAGRLWFLSDYGLAVTEADRPDRDGATLNLFHPLHSIRAPCPHSRLALLDVRRGRLRLIVDTP